MECVLDFDDTPRDRETSWNEESFSDDRETLWEANKDDAETPTDGDWVIL